MPFENRQSSAGTAEPYGCDGKHGQRELHPRAAMPLKQDTRPTRLPRSEREITRRGAIFLSGYLPESEIVW